MRIYDMKYIVSYIFGSVFPYLFLNLRSLCFTPFQYLTLSPSPSPKTRTYHPQWLLPFYFDNSDENLQAHSDMLFDPWYLILMLLFDFNIEFSKLKFCSMLKMFVEIDLIGLRNFLNIKQNINAESSKVRSKQLC